MPPQRQAILSQGVSAAAFRVLVVIFFLLYYNQAIIMSLRMDIRWHQHTDDASGHHCLTDGGVHNAQ